MAQQYLDDKERELLQKISANPLDLITGELKSYLEEFIRVLLPEDRSAQWVAGDRKIISKDLSANSTEFIYTDASGEWLYENGAVVSQETYGDLYEFYGPDAFGIDTATHFTLPDTRGRSMYMTGTNVFTDLGDSDNMPEASRQAQHQHSLSGASVAAHTHTDGTLAVASHSHTVNITSGTISANHTHDFSGTTGSMNGSQSHEHGSDLSDFWGGASGTGFYVRDGGNPVFEFSSAGTTAHANIDHQHGFSGTTGTVSANHTHDVNGNTGSASPDVTGSTGSASPSVSGGLAGSGMVGDAPAHIFIGSSLVKI